MTNHKAVKYDLGIIGLGVMGRNLLLNIAGHGFFVAGYDKEIAKVRDLKKDSQKYRALCSSEIKDFVASLKKPRTFMLLVPAGEPVDAVINELLPFIDKRDLIVDAGNSWFKDTDIRIRTLAEKGIQFLGVGISGGAEGARKGPSIMPGGSKEAYERVKPIFEAISAKADGFPCVAWLGQKSAGHFVKMVHNGIEYAMMQLIAETYDLLKRGLDLDEEELHDVFSVWNIGETNSYLMDITSHIFSKQDSENGTYLINKILGVADQNGTGKWTSQIATELQVPVPTIDQSVAMRSLSRLIHERNAAGSIYNRPMKPFTGDRQTYISHVHRAFGLSMIIVYAQGLALLRVASDKYEYRLDFETLATVWQGGCIIRAELLKDIRDAFHANSGLSNLLLDPELSRRVIANQEELRHVVCFAIDLGVPVPAFTSALSYFDAYRSVWLPANLTSAQRDFFGSHPYRRIDAEGMFHTQWKNE